MFTRVLLGLLLLCVLQSSVTWAKKERTIEQAYEDLLDSEDIVVHFDAFFEEFFTDTDAVAQKQDVIIPRLISDMHEESNEDRLHKIVQFLHAMSEDEANRDALIHHGVVNPLLSLFRDTTDRVKIILAATIHQLADTEERCHLFLEANVVPALMAMMQSSYPFSAESAANCIWALSVPHATNDYLRRSGVVPLLQRMAAVEIPEDVEEGTEYPGQIGKAIAVGVLRNLGYYDHGEEL